MRNWRSKYDKDALSKNSSSTFISLEQPIPVIHGHSSAVYPRPNDWPDYASITGYWFLPSETLNESLWEPPKALSEFLESGPAPVYFGFGSMVSTDPSKLTNVILTAINKTGIRAVISTGWGGVTAVKNSATIYVLESAPHEWLFPQMAAVVHHGGAGTTAAGLRAGCPTIICPYGLDQPFWGRRVAELGAGVDPIQQKQLTDAILAEAINIVTTDESFRASAQLIAKAIENEHGIANAVSTIERLALVNAKAE